ncbi:MAG: hypothetical protein AAGB24_05835 [Bacteroidota bacterium]
MKYSIIIFAILLTTNVFTQNDYLIKKINEDVYIFTEIWEADNNGNLGVVIGKDGVLLISTLMRNSVENLEKEIRKITDKPVKYIINSDHDPYNHHANKYFHDRGATIFSHQNLKYSPAFTDILFERSISIPIGNETVTAYHTPSHTLDHIDIYLEKSNVLFMSDGFRGDWLAYTGPNGIDGYLKGIDKALSISNDHTIIVTGNTSKDKEKYLYNRNDLIKMRQIHVAFTNRVIELHKMGMDVESITTDTQIETLVKNLQAYDTHLPSLRYLIMQTVEVDSDEAYTLTNEELSSYVGVYELIDNRNIEIVLQSGKLYARKEGAFLFELTPLSKTKFDIRGLTISNHLEFHVESTGEVKSLTSVLEKDGWWFNIIKEGTRIKK